MAQVAYILFFLGILFGFLGNVGVMRFPDIYTRLQASSKCGITSVLSILIASMLLKGFSPMTGRIFVIMIFFLITGPVASHIIGRKAWEEGIIPWKRKPGRGDKKL